jgi:hypothetical protein
VRSETGKKRLFHQREDGLAYVRSRGTPERHPIADDFLIEPPDIDEVEAKVRKLLASQRGETRNS